MKKLSCILWILFAAIAFADIPESRTVDIAGGMAPMLNPYQANVKSYLWSIKNNGAVYSIGSGTPFMYWATNNRSGAIVTAACTVVSATSGTFVAKFSAASLNTNGTMMYGVGISSGGVTVARQGVMVITPDPYASGAQPITFSTNVNADLITFIGTITAPFFVGDGSGLTGIGGAATNGLAAIVYVDNSTNLLSAELRGIIPTTNGFVTASITNPLSDRVSNLTAADVGAVSPDDATYTDTVARASTALQEDTYLTNDPAFLGPVFGVMVKAKYTFFNAPDLKSATITAMNIYATNNMVITDPSILTFGSLEGNRFRFKPNGQSFPMMEYEDVATWTTAYISSNAIDPSLDAEYRLVYDFTPTSNEMTRLAGINATNITAATNLALWKSGGTMTGALNLYGPAVNSNEAVTLSQLISAGGSRQDWYLFATTNNSVVGPYRYCYGSIPSNWTLSIAHQAFTNGNYPDALIWCINSNQISSVRNRDLSFTLRCARSGGTSLLLAPEIYQVDASGVGGEWIEASQTLLVDSTDYNDFTVTIANNQNWTINPVTNLLIKIKTITKTGNTGLLLHGGSGVISRVSFPTAETIDLGERGLTNFTASGAQAGTYNTASRTFEYNGTIGNTDVIAQISATVWPPTPIAWAVSNLIDYTILSQSYYPTNIGTNYLNALSPTNSICTFRFDIVNGSNTSWNTNNIRWNIGVVTNGTLIFDWSTYLQKWRVGMLYGESL